MTKHLVILICVLQFMVVSCRAQISGCTDPLANNYDPSATVNDGSCSYYAISVSPVSTFELSETIEETSGLSLWDGYVWTHNDNADNKLYGLDTTNGGIKLEFILPGVVNIGWEEISQDEEYLYIGDFGNNLSGNRTDLHLLRVEKNSLNGGSAIIDTIWFSYSDQFDMSPAEPNQTEYDCEAFIVSEDSIYLFTKQWVSAQTSVYVIPKIPGTYSARKKDSYNIQGLITGATYLEPKKLIVLCGYTSLLHPFLFLMYDFKGRDFFSGNNRRVTISLPFHQIEGIASNDGLKYYLSNEKFIQQPIANYPQKLHLLVLDDLLKSYIDDFSNVEPVRKSDQIIRIFPNPVGDFVTILSSSSLIGSEYNIFDHSGREILNGKFMSENKTIDLSKLAPGPYLLMVGGYSGKVFSILKH